jgi:hypothetical protein
MGNSTWVASAYNTYAANTGYEKISIRDVFCSSGVNDKLNPKNITLRESVDSEANPNSTPIILGLDVTGSMGKYVVTDPHMMFMGIDDIHCGQAPLQVSQFEADIKIVEQLRDIYLVGGGGGNDSESYDLAWYFAANFTKIDSFDKRNSPGFIFTFGDEMAPTAPVTKQHFDKFFNNSIENKDLYPSEMLAAAQEKYQVFHIVIEQGSFYYRRSPSVRSSWTELLGNNVLYLRDTEYLTDVVMATLSIASGNNIETVINESRCPEELTYAFENTLRSY